MAGGRNRLRGSASAGRALQNAPSQPLLAQQRRGASVRHASCRMSLATTFVSLSHDMQGSRSRGACQRVNVNQRRQRAAASLMCGTPVCSQLTLTADTALAVPGTAWGLTSPDSDQAAGPGPWRRAAGA